MSLRLRRLRPALAAALLLIVGLISCGREVTGPGGRGTPATVALNPVFGTVTLAGTGEVLSIGSVVDFDRVRVVLLRANGDTAVDELVPFPPESTTVRLAFTLTLGEGATSQGEPLDATLKYLNAAGDTVFSGGPIAVLARPASNPGAAPDVPLDYTGPGANAAAIEIAPRSFVGTIGQGNTFTATVRDAQASVLANAPVAFTSTDSNRVRVNIRTGATTLIGARGSARIIAQTLTGQADTADVSITPTPSAVVLVSGGAQNVRAGEVFPQPVRVRVNAVDGQGVEGVAVDFSVTQGGGSVTPATGITDVNGEATATWTAGTVAGTGTLRASVLSNTIGINVAGNQLSANASSLQFSASPSNFAAGDTIPPFNVIVLDATSDTVSGFAGLVSLELTGGAGNANLVGAVVSEAVNGVASFSGLTIDRAGTGYRLVARVTGVPNAQSALFDVSAAPARFVTLISGGGQTAPASTALADSIRVRVTDVFGFPVGGATVSFTVALGGGTVSPTSRVTDAAGFASTSWTLGANGTQQITAGVSGLNPVPVSATIFAGGGSPTLFVGAGSVATTVGGSRAVPIFVNPAATSTVVAQLVSRDTAIARWQVDSVVFTVGSTLRSPSILGRSQGSTWAVITSPIGTDSVLVAVDSASVGLQIDPFRTMAVGDTLRTLVRLTEPAPPGGITAVVRSTSPGAVLVSPWSGLGVPDEACQFYCDNLRASPDGPTILAPPADSALIIIPEGRIDGHLAVFLLDTALAAPLTVTAPGFVSGGISLEIRRPTLQFFSSYSTFGTLLPVGSRDEVFFQLSDSPTSDRVARVTARVPGSVRVDSLAILRRGDFSSSDIPVEILAPDSSWVVVEIPGVPVDSFLVRGAPPITQISLTTSLANRGAAFTFSAGVLADTTFGAFFGALPPRAIDLPLTIISRDPAIARVDVGSSIIPQGQITASLTVRAVSGGSTWIVVSAPGAGADSAQITVQSGSLFAVQNGPSVGIGQVHRSMFVSTNEGTFDDPQWVEASISSSDSTVLLVATPTIGVSASGQTDNVRLVGRSAGTAIVTISAPGFASLTRTFTVSAARVVLSNFATPSTINPDSVTIGLSTNLVDPSGSVRPSADTLFGLVQSTNPAVLQVTDSIIQFNANGTAFDGSVRAIAPGTAQLVVTAPGAIPDTSATITVRPPRLEISSPSISTGAGMRQVISVIRRAPPGTALPLTVTVQGPANVTPVNVNDTLPAGSPSYQYLVNTGTVIGVDTVIVGSPGLNPDTVLLNVGASRVLPNTVSTLLVGLEAEVGAQVRPVATFSASLPDIVRRFVVTARDTSVLAVLADTVELVPTTTNPSRFGRIRARRPGTSYVVMSDPLGVFQPDSLFVTAEAQTLRGSNVEITLAMRERSDEFEMYVFRDFSSSDSLWVQLASSSPSLVSVPDSVLIPGGQSFAYFQVESGDSVGGAIVTASASGFLPYRWNVGVSRGELVPFADGDRLSVGNERRIAIYTRSASTYDTHEPLDTIPVRIRSDQPSVLGVGTDTILDLTAVNAGLQVFGPLRGNTLGSSLFTTEDLRSGNFRQLIGSRGLIEVFPARLEANSSFYTITPGLTSDFVGSLTTENFGDSAVVTATSNGGRVVVTPDPIEIGLTIGSTVSFSLRGVSPGLDTVVFSAPGYIPDTIQVRLADGTLRTNVAPPPRFFANESIQFTVVFHDAGGRQASVGPNGLPLTFSSTGQMLARRLTDGTPLTSATVADGEFQYTFFLSATTVGEGTVTISAPGMLPLVIRTQVISRPE
ncbi:MAG: hypothetical protein IT357_03365 [Gemmatimonadaceae bacterium]|nr:hypothetical protein [Gemmatimonadaceae bacterium]